MQLLLVTFAAVFGVTFLAAPRMGAGWFWDAGNALGFAAGAGFLYLSITGRRLIDVRVHQRVGYGVLALAMAHAYWFLLGDAAVIDFLKPRAPLYLWAGVLGLLLLGLLITIALVPDRYRIHRDHRLFRHWHRWLAVATLVAVTWHIVASGFYLYETYQVVLFVLLAGVACIGWRGSAGVPTAGARSYLGISTLCIVAFIVIRDVLP